MSPTRCVAPYCLTVGQGLVSKSGKGVSKSFSTTRIQLSGGKLASGAGMCACHSGSQSTLPPEIDLAGTYGIPLPEPADDEEAATIVARYQEILELRVSEANSQQACICLTWNWILQASDDSN